MRKTAISFLALLAALLVATPVAAADPSKTVSISASRAVVVYGQNITLSGKISTPQSGQKVDVLAKPFGLSTMSALSTVETTNTGQWSFATKPTIQTTYQARWTSETSSAIDVKVRPAITLATVRFRGRLGTFTTSAIAAREFAGNFVFVQRVTSFGTTTLTWLAYATPFRTCGPTGTMSTLSTWLGFRMISVPAPPPARGVSSVRSSALAKTATPDGTF